MTLLTTGTNPYDILCDIEQRSLKIEAELTEFLVNEKQKIANLPDCLRPLVDREISFEGYATTAKLTK